MGELPVFYATTEGQTRRIAERLAALLHERGIDSRAIDVQSAEAREIDWGAVRAVAIGASVHGGRHQQAINTFVRANKDALQARPALFFSVSMRAASPSPGEREGARQLAQAFVNAAGWHPPHVVAVAGRLAYTKYGWLMRWFISRIAKRGGLATDTSQDHEYTDWAQVARLADELAAAVHGAAPCSERVAS
jgi:menaquinone-dependent protoporphyrinogen oxidase